MLMRFSNSRQPHSSRASTREKVRGKRALRNATVFVCVPLARNYRLAALHFGVFLTMRGRAFREGNLAGATRSTGIFIPAHLPFPSAELPAGGPSTAGRSPHTAPMPGCEPCTEAPAVSRNSNASRCALDGNSKRNIVLVTGESQQERFPLMAGRRPGHPERLSQEEKLDARVSQVGFSRFAHLERRCRVNPTSFPRMRKGYWPGHALELIRRPGIRGTRISGTVGDLRATIPARARYASLAGMTWGASQARLGNHVRDDGS
jgi:hypothetical protein